MAQADLTTVVNITLNLIGKYKGWGTGAENTERWDDTTVSNVAKIVDLEIAATIAKTPGHPSSNSMFVDSSRIGHKEQLPVSLAGYANIRVDENHAEEAASTGEIEALRSEETVPADDLYYPYYKIWGRTLYHTGDDGIVGYFPNTVAPGATLLSPVEYTYAIVIGTLRLMALKDWGEGSIGAELAQEYRSRLDLIKQDATLGIVRETPPPTVMG